MTARRSASRVVSTDPEVDEEYATKNYVDQAIIDVVAGEINVNMSDIDGLNTALAGKQPIDADLTAIADLTPVDNDIIQRKSGVWTTRTVTQLKIDMSLQKSDVGLTNVDNTADVDKPVSTATQTALNSKADASSLSSKQDASSELTAIASLLPADNNVLQRKSGAWTSRTPTQLKADLAIGITDVSGLSTALSGKEGTVTPGSSSQYYRGDKTWQTLDKTVVGLSNVDNTSDATKPISTAVQNALDTKATVTALSSLQTAVDGKANTSHTHSTGDVTGLSAALNAKENVLNPGLASQYYRGDKTWQTLDKSSVGLSNVTNNPQYYPGGSDVAVIDGGTGRSSSVTPYGVIAAGTTATNPQQTIAPGTSGHFLKSSGSGALPTFAAITTADVSGLGSIATQANPAGGPAGLTATQTLTQTRVQKRVNPQTSLSSFTPNCDTEDGVEFTALASALTIAAPSGTPTRQQTYLFRFKDNGVARALTWNILYRAIGVTLPLTTVVSKILYVGCVWNATDSRWDVIGVSQET